MIVDITVIIIAGSVICILALLIWRTYTNDARSFYRVYDRLVKEHRLSIHYKDVFDKKIIGFDGKNRKLLLLDCSEKGKLAVCLDLSDIGSCGVIHRNDPFSKLPKTVLLELTEKDTDRRIVFCFYDDACDNAQDRSSLILKARHWSQRINFHKNYWWMGGEEYA